MKVTEALEILLSGGAITKPNWRESKMYATMEGGELTFKNMEGKNLGGIKNKIHLSTEDLASNEWEKVDPEKSRKLEELRDFCDKKDFGSCKRCPFKDLVINECCCGDFDDITIPDKVVNAFHAIMKSEPIGRIREVSARVNQTTKPIVTVESMMRDELKEFCDTYDHCYECPLHGYQGEYTYGCVCQCYVPTSLPDEAVRERYEKLKEVTK